MSKGLKCHGESLSEDPGKGLPCFCLSGHTGRVFMDPVEGSWTRLAKYVKARSTRSSKRKAFIVKGVNPVSFPKRGHTKDGPLRCPHPPDSPKG